MEFNPHRPPVEIFADPITKVYSDIVDQLLVNIASQFDVTNPAIGTAEWQFQQLAHMGQLTKANIATIASMTKQNTAIVQDALERSALAALDSVEPQFAAAVKKGLLNDAGAVMSDRIKSVLSAYHDQALNKLNLVNTTMIESSAAAYKKAVSSVSAYVQMSESQAKTAQQILNTAAGSVATGAESRIDAVRRAMKEMSDAGITGFVDKSGKKWSAEAYVNMDVRTTCGNVATEAAFARNADYGNDLIWWPILATARPGCYPYQGKVCSTTGRSGTVEDLDGNQIPFIALSSTTYGEPAGIGGINCHHKPPNIFIPGLSKLRGEVPPKDENDKRYEKGQAKKRAEREARYAKRDAEIASATKDAEMIKKTDKAEQKIADKTPTLKKIDGSKKETESTSDVVYRSYQPNAPGYIIKNDKYALTGVEEGKTIDLAPNDTDKAIVYRAPSTSGFANGKYVSDDNKNAIMSNGNIVLNSYQANNSMRRTTKNIVESECARLGGATQKGVYYRGTNNKNEIDLIKNGKLRPSVNHDTGVAENGLSVWSGMNYANYNYFYKVSGIEIGTGSDGEPILDVGSLKVVKGFTKGLLQDFSEKTNKGKIIFAEKYGWTQNQIESALRGDYDNAVSLIG